MRIVPMRNWSIPAGRIFGIEIRVHLTFLFLLFFVWITEFEAHGHASAGRGLALVGIIFLSVVLPELGHALLPTRGGVPAKTLILLPTRRVTLLDDSGTLADTAGEPSLWHRDSRLAP